MMSARAQGALMEWKLISKRIIPAGLLKVQNTDGRKRIMQNK